MKLSGVKNSMTPWKTPTYGAQCFTWNVAQQLSGDSRSVTHVDESNTIPYCLRLSPKYRTEAAKQFRKDVAREAKRLRWAARLKLANQKEAIESQADIVRDSYKIHGFDSVQYHSEFEKLAEMKLTYMADNYRLFNQIPEGEKTPYDKEADKLGVEL